MLFWALGVDDWLWQEKLTFGIWGFGLIVGGGFSEALLHDPVDCDVFPFRVLARVGFLLAGAGAGIYVAVEDEPMIGAVVAGLIIVPVGISLIHLIWAQRRKQ